MYTKATLSRESRLYRSELTGLLHEELTSVSALLLLMHDFSLSSYTFNLIGDYPLIGENGAEDEHGLHIFPMVHSTHTAFRKNNVAPSCNIFEY